MIRRDFLIGLLLALLLLLPCFHSSEAETAQQITLVVNDRTVYCDVPPVMVNDRVFVPLRAAMEAIGARVIWNPDKQEVFIRRPPYPALFVTIGDQRIRVHSWWEHNPDVYRPRYLWVESPPFIAEGRTMVPIRAIAEHFGHNVEWIDSQRLVKLQPRHKSWVSEVVEVKGKAVVVVRTDKGMGSGFVVRRAAPPGQVRLGVQTACHVVEGATRIEVKAHNGKWYAATVFHKSPERDTAVLDVQPGWEAEIGDVQEESYWWELLSHHLEVGEEVVCIGHPLGLENSVSTGIIAAKREVPSWPYNLTLYQVTAPLSPGSSGAPVFNREGAYIGHVMGGIQEGQLINFVIAN